MADLTYGINPHQSVAGMVADYEKQVKAEEAKYYDPDITDGSVSKEDMEPNREGERQIARGRMDANTGLEIPLTAKARRLTQWVPSPQFQKNYEAIRWDT